MLPPFIIEQIRKREERQREDKRPMLELPLIQIIPESTPTDPGEGPFVSPCPDSEKPQRGVIVVDL